MTLGKLFPQDMEAGSWLVGTFLQSQAASVWYDVGTGLVGEYLSIVLEKNSPGLHFIFVSKLIVTVTDRKSVV